ncbi:MAG: hypothetical protein IJ682_13705 [Lachnospiraceae bacterium]|nr:hypothetical protein [Lachnospiraceae bacterium]
MTGLLYPVRFGGFFIFKNTKWRYTFMKIKKRIFSLALAGALTLGLLPAFSSPALAADGETSYTLTIPSTLTVANSGWNPTSGISATGTLASGKKLTVTASSANSWALKQQDGNETVSYTMKETSDGEAKTAWEFTTLPGSATLGIDVADYSTKPAGTYQDTVTFTAKVENSTVLSGALVDGATIKVNFKWRGSNRGDYVQGVYNASSGTFTVTKGGGYWGSEERAVYKVEKSGDNIIIGAGYYDYGAEAMVWSFDTTNDTYTYTQGSTVSSLPSYYGLISVTLNGTDITNQLTQN